MGNHDERIAFDLSIEEKPEKSQEEASARRSVIEFTKKKHFTRKLNVFEDFTTKFSSLFWQHKWTC